MSTLSGSRARARLGDAVELPETLVFDFPTLRQLEGHLRTLVQQAVPSVSALSSLGGGPNPVLLAQLLGALGTASSATVPAPDAALLAPSHARCPWLTGTSCELPCGSDSIHGHRAHRCKQRKLSLFIDATSQMLFLIIIYSDIH